MIRGSYNVEHAGVSPAKKDTSFRSCVCALLVVLCICLIGLFVTAFFRESRKEKESVFGSESQNEDLVTKLSEQPPLSITTKMPNENTVGVELTQTTTGTSFTKTTISNLNEALNNISTKFFNVDTTIKIQNTTTIATETVIETSESTVHHKIFDGDSTESSITAYSTVSETELNIHQNTAFTKNVTLFSKPPEIFQSSNKEEYTPSSTTTANIKQSESTVKQTSANTSLPKPTETSLEDIQAITTTTTTTTEPNILLNLKNFAFSNSNVCETASCKTIAVDILASMNHSVDPCDDFYQFACGRYRIKETGKHQKFLFYVNQITNNSPNFLKAVKIFFDSCILHETEFLSSGIVQQARQLVDNVGELIIDNTKDVTIQELSKLLAQLILRQSIPFFDVDLNIHSTNENSNYVLQLTLPQHSASKWSSLSENRRRCLRLQSGKTYGTNLNMTEIYESFVECQRNYSVYLDSMENVVRTLGILKNVKNDSQLLSIIKEIRFTVEDILKILEILPSTYEVRHFLINQDKTIMTVTDLTKHFSQLDWNIFLKTLAPTIYNPDNLIEVYILDYFKKAFQELVTLGYKKVFNALIAIYAQDVYTNVVFEPLTSNREDFCVERTIDLFPDIMNYIYKINEKSFVIEKNITQIIFNKLTNQLTLSLDNAYNWMDNDVREKFKNKINNVTLLFNEDSDFSSVDFERKYQNFSIVQEAYVSNIEEAVVRRRQNLYSLWGKGVKKDDIFNLFIQPGSNQPLYFNSENTLYVPDGMLKNINEDSPFYLAMSSVGLRLAKALATSFDPINIKSILSKSNTYNSLVESTREQLKHVNEIILDGRDVTLNLNGSLSVNKRIVDNAAFRLLIDASQPDDLFNEVPLPLISLYYSREKVIFISAIQEFCEETFLLNDMQRIYESENLPASLMVENVLINSQNFAATFECKPGSSMNIFDVRYQFPYLEKVEDYNNYEYEISN